MWIGFIMEKKTVSIGSEHKGHIKQTGVVQPLLHPFADGVLIGFGFAAEAGFLPGYFAASTPSMISTFDLRSRLFLYYPEIKISAVTKCVADFSNLTSYAIEYRSPGKNLNPNRGRHSPLGT
ncbi:hypothetical protein C7M51_04145 [Mixta intestinalis]|uniref:Uncharacterized protein n=1 Tax=Mixta intestinalis TaxID=1615494 RepID=A0A6P1Q6W5_9GAMM|nr:hypothetical protein C7M51_04145 [Mixta intestinalis]